MFLRTNSQKTTMYSDLQKYVIRPRSNDIKFAKLVSDLCISEKLHGSTYRQKYEKKLKLK